MSASGVSPAFVGSKTSSSGGGGRGGGGGAATVSLSSVPSAYSASASSSSAAASGGAASAVRGLRAAGSSSSGGAAAANLFKTKHNPFLKTFNTLGSLSNAHNISSGKELIEDFDNKIKLVYDDFSEKSADLTAIIEMFIQDLKEGKKTIKGLNEEDKKEIQKRINLQEEGLARIKVGFSPVKVQQNGLKILGKRKSRKSRKSRARKTRKTKH
jgi:hypothetical protein